MNGRHRLSQSNVGLAFLVSLERPHCRHPIVQAMTWRTVLQNLAPLVPEQLTSEDDANLPSSLSVPPPCGTGTCAVPLTLLPGRTWGGGSTDKPRL
jgi:hypothetical protein